MDRAVRLLVILGVALATSQPPVSGASWVTPGGLWRGWKGVSEASSPDPAAWRAADFDDQTWPEWRLPVHFGEALAGTELADMQGSYSCVFLRRTFVEPAPGEIALLRLGVVCDAGFVAWLNGRELVRLNVPDGEPTSGAAAASEPPDPVAFGSYDIPIQSGWVLPGTNVLAVQVFSSSRLQDNDFLFDAGFDAEWDTAAPRVEAVIPAPDGRLRTFSHLEVQFDEPVAGVEAADLLINGVAATGVLELAPGDFLFTFANPADGTVTVGWRADHGITDRVADAHPYAAETWSYVVDSAMLASGVFLSEFMADNRKTLNDEDGDSSDWIEIANSSEEPANLSGWFLTDDPGQLKRWPFPDVDVPARGYLLVFASGKNRTNATAKLHTDFRLAAEGGYLALVDPSGAVVSDFAPGYPQQWTDVGYGRVSGAEDAWGYFNKPTPGKANTTSGPGFAPAVDFTRVSGAFTNPFPLTLSVPLPNAVIRFTTNGTVPALTSWVYQAPLWISNTAQIRARAFAEGLLPGPPRSETFYRLHTNLVKFTSNLPVLVLNTAGRPGASSSKLTFAHLSVYEPVNGRTTLLQPPTLLTRVGFQIRGSSTEGIAKSSYKVEVWDEFDMDKKVEVLGLPADSDWVLYAPNSFEPVMIHNPFIHQLSRDMGQYSSRTRFVELYYNRTIGPLTTNMYAGIYVLEEKIKISPDRVAIDELEPENVLAPEVTGGYLFKIDRLDPGDTGLSVAGVTLGYVDPKEREMKLAQWLPHRTYIRSYFTNFYSVLNGSQWLNPTNGYRKFVDVDAWIDFHVLETFSFNVDALVLSTYLHKPRNGRITFGPHWDFDRALGSTDGRDANPKVWHSGGMFTAPWWSRMFTDKDFGQQWLDRWQALRTTHLSLTNLHGLIDRLANEVRSAQPREYQKWRVTLRGGTYQSEVNYMKTWVSNRVNWIDSQLTRPPVLSHLGGPVSPGLQVTLTVPTNTAIYYTLNGTDPRLSQDGFAPAARIYTGPIVIQNNTRIVARARDAKKKQTGGAPSNVPWSGPVAATYVVRTPLLLLTEIMYHPAKDPGDPSQASDYEYLELMNAGTTPLDLVGFRLTNGVDYVFTASSGVTRLAPGDRVLVVANREAFLRRYPGTGGIAGEYTGRLGDASDRITVVGPLVEPVSDVAYEDTWESTTDGLGFSLVLADETSAPADVGRADRWRRSTRAGGSPGAADLETPPIPRVWVNEILTHPAPPDQDAVEVLNPTRAPADLSGWYLTDDYDTPIKYRIPDGTVVPAGGYLVLEESDFGQGPAGFGFSAYGDDVYLFSADPLTGALTGYFDGYSFGGCVQGGTLGLQIAGGHRTLVPQALPTLGGPNAGAAMPHVQITEILYAAPQVAGDEATGEYIELHNASTEPVCLGETAAAAGGWLLRGAVDFDFPGDVVLPANGYLVVVGFDPRLDLGRLAAFRAYYGVPPDTAFAGPWSGRLDNAGETVRLLCPAPRLASPGQPPSSMAVEEIPYRPTSPWPAAAAVAGRSLSRVSGRIGAGDPQAWIAALPSPGAFDADGDGLDDVWEARWGLSAISNSGADGPDGDPDGDGVSNRFEFIGRTAPWWGPIELAIDADPAANGVVVRFRTLPGRRHELQTRPLDDSHAGWATLLEIAPEAEARDHSHRAPVDGTSRLYRVLVLE